MEEQKDTREKTNWNIRPYLSIGLTAFLVITGAIAFYFLMYRYTGVTKFIGQISVILRPITFGLVIAYLMVPIVNFEERHLLPLARKKMKNPEKADKLVRVVSVFGALLFFVLFIGILLLMVIPELYRSINGLIITLPKQVNSFMDWLNAYVSSDSKISGYLEIGLKNGNFSRTGRNPIFCRRRRTLWQALPLGSSMRLKLYLMWRSVLLFQFMCS